MENTPILIVNPVAGGGSAQRQIPVVRSELKKYIAGDVEILATTRQGEATSLAQNASVGGASLLIAMGGDGTINEVANGLLAAENPGCELGIINCGSGGGLAQTLGLPEKLADQLALIFETAAKPLDTGLVQFEDQAGKISTRFFVSECQIGFGGEVVSKVGMKHKKLGGTLAFGTVAVSCLFSYRGNQMTVGLDKQDPISENLLGIVIGNGSHCAGGMQLTPCARPDDGLLDVLRIREMPVLKRVSQFAKVYSGTHIHSSFFTLETARSISIESDIPVWVEMDGELIGKTPCKVEIHHQALRVRY